MFPLFSRMNTISVRFLLIVLSSLMFVGLSIGNEEVPVVAFEATFYLPSGV